jgi:hypothetical protein
MATASFKTQVTMATVLGSGRQSEATADPTVVEGIRSDRIKVEQRDVSISVDMTTTFSFAAFSITE